MAIIIKSKTELWEYKWRATSGNKLNAEVDGHVGGVDFDELNI